MTQQVRPLQRGAIRAIVAVAALSVVWGLAFATQVLPFFPTIAAGGTLTGLAGFWVRAGTRGQDRDGTLRRHFPGFALTPGQAALAAGVAVLHLGVGHGLFALSERLLPVLTETAAEVYTRAGGIPLWAAVLLGGVVTAPLEEVFWRGAVQSLVMTRIHERMPRLVAIPGGPVIGASLVYALFHVATGQIALVAAALLGGLVWGGLLERTRSVGATMLAHGLWTSLMLVFPPV